MKYTNMEKKLDMKLLQKRFNKIKQEVLKEEYIKNKKKGNNGI